MTTSPRGTARLAILVSLVLGAAGCTGNRATTSDGAPQADSPSADGLLSDAFGATGPLRINEVVSSNDGVALDEHVEADDLIELLNSGDEPLWLDDYAIADNARQLHPLPHVELLAGETVLLWADDEPAQGELHLPFKLSSTGDELTLVTNGETVDKVSIPALPQNHSLARLPDGNGAWAVCRYPTPGAANGTSCGAPAPPEIGETVSFAPYSWPRPWPTPAAPLAITELSLRPESGKDGYVELVNQSDQVVALSAYELRLSPHGPGLGWPDMRAGTATAWPSQTVAAGGRLLIPLTAGDTATLETDPQFEGVLTLFRRQDGVAVARVDFMHWPRGAVLARYPETNSHHRFCAVGTPGRSNSSCSPLASRPLGDRARHLRTPADFDTLAAGGTGVGMQPVKFLIDMQAGDVVHLLSTRAWDLHYRFVRELIYRQSHLDRCDPRQAAIFLDGWQRFSWTEYFQVETRRFLQGTLVHHTSSGHRTVEHASGDAISGSQMERGFFAIARHLDQPARWLLRPQDPAQVSRARGIEGRVPLIGPNAPYRGLRLQLLSQGVGYGTLQFVAAGELGDARLGHDTIVVTDDVPNDIPFVGGLITEAFQTPLAHVNVLSKSRNTPNMALRDARTDPQISRYIGQLVRLEVGAGGYELELADPAEAEAFWRERRPGGAPRTPQLDPTVRGIVPLLGQGIEALPAIGAKAAQLAELQRVGSARRANCQSRTLATPPGAFAVPMIHYIEHAERSGARALLSRLQQSVAFRSDPLERAAGLAQVRQLIVDHPVDGDLLNQVEQTVRAQFGQERVRFRSSSNAEDLSDFNGAGLYDSVSAQLANPERRVADALRRVWASLWNMRAYDEREFARIDHDGVAMAVLVHRAFRSERANGVAVSRSLIDPTRDDFYYVNVQLGEASVTNPAPGISTEQLIYRWYRTPDLEYRSRSSFDPQEQGVMRVEEVRELACALAAIHDHFRPLLDPEQENYFYAMEVEFKLTDPLRELVVKQARPYSFGNIETPADCR